MVQKFVGKNSIQADVIVLGCTLPGIVTAHKLKRKFGNTMDIMVLDLPNNDLKAISKLNVAFHDKHDSDTETDDNPQDEYTTQELLDNVARFYLVQYAKEFKLPLPQAIINPGHKYNEHKLTPAQSKSSVEVNTAGNSQTAVEQDKTKSEAKLQAQQPQSEEGTQPAGEAQPDDEEELYETLPIIEEEETIPLQKLFQYPDGNTVEFLNNLHDFEYLSFLEKFELNQYQTYLDRSMKDLFQTNRVKLVEERQILMYYDRTTMEKNICETLLFSTSREIMRIIVRLVCGAPADSVSLLFYLHQCYRTSSTRNHLGGLNTRFREKLLGHCRKRLASKLHQSIADITLQTKSIKEIRTYSEQVILETIKGTTYICNLLAMALRPDQLHNIQVEDQLLSEENAKMTKEMTPGRAKKFTVEYKENFWERQGYSGDIFSMRGPIIWAMQQPRLATTGALEKYSALIGYLMACDDKKESKEAVLEQLVNLFGEEASQPVSYRETAIADVYVPRCGDYVALRRLTNEGSPKFLEWGALDIFAEGDVAAALEAGHTAYLHLLGCLRPQAQTYHDIIASDWPTSLSENPVKKWMSQINMVNGIKITVYTAAVIMGVKLLRSYMNR